MLIFNLKKITLENGEFFSFSIKEKQTFVFVTIKVKKCTKVSTFPWLGKVDVFYNIRYFLLLIENEYKSKLS